MDRKNKSKKIISQKIKAQEKFYHGKRDCPRAGVPFPFSLNERVLIKK